MSLCCQQDDRRDLVRGSEKWYGLDYVEVSTSQMVLYAYFLGDLPPELKGQANLVPFLQLSGGERVKGIKITSVAIVDLGPESDGCLKIQLDKYGDFSTYTLRLVGLHKVVDPGYDHADFSFKVDCPADLDCAPTCNCPPPVLDEPDINYLAKDYTSFRQLILDRLALLLPDWDENHIPDLMIALVEILAYTGDYLSYYQDAVGTEAYLDTARQRISVRRHSRLVDYTLEEGCNARAWVCLEITNPDKSNDPWVLEAGAGFAFVTALNPPSGVSPAVRSWADMASVPPASYEVFEPLLLAGASSQQFHPAHNEIYFYTWGNTECCLGKGSVSATLLDGWASPSAESPATDVALAPDQKPRLLQLKPGDVLIFEEILGPDTGLAADADPTHRQAVRLTRVTPGLDQVNLTSGQPTPCLLIEWSAADALLFPACLSVIGPAPACAFLSNITVARGNVVLVDHGKSIGPESLGQVPTLTTTATCECVGEPGDIQILPGPFNPALSQTPLTYRQSLPADDAASSQWVSAAALLVQDPQSALPQLHLQSTPAVAWTPLYDLIESGPDDQNFVVEIDDNGVANLRFGDGELGWQPPAGMSFSASYRIGNGTSGNVGAGSIVALVCKGTQPTRVTGVRNPLPAQGGTDAEPMAQAQLLAPGQFREQIERAITAADYAQLAERNPDIQNAAAALIWTGSWFEAEVAIDPLGTEVPAAPLLADITHFLYPFRRIGHDLRIMPAIYVSLDLRLEVCALPGYLRAHVQAALMQVFGTGVLAGGQPAFFSPDNLTFGGGIYLSQIIAAAQTVTGVECVKVTRFQRLFQQPNGELAAGVLYLAANEIARLDNDPNYPEHGKLEIQVNGGR